MTNNAIDAPTTKRLVEGGLAVLVDIRATDERARKRIPGALGIPMGAIEAGELRSETRTIIFHCASGHRTHAHAGRLLAAVPGGARILSGGLAAWEKAGGSVERDPHRPIEIMRQVQIAAGSLVVLGVVLSLTISPWFVGLAAFVGAGLIFAGITGFCGMARLLAWMPWNRASERGASFAADVER
jgi:rhodanese-related sulfurtransferase